MKLGEALILRANAQKRLEQLRERLNRNAKVQEGDTPSEDPNELLKELESTAEQFTVLIQQINKTNSTTALEDGLTLADALAVRDVLRLKHSIYKSLVDHASVIHNRYSRSEVKYSSTIAVATIQQIADQLAKEHRELDTKLQAANWQTDLVDVERGT